MYQYLVHFMTAIPLCVFFFVVNIVHSSLGAHLGSVHLLAIMSRRAVKIHYMYLFLLSVCCFPSAGDQNQGLMLYHWTTSPSPWFFETGSHCVAPSILNSLCSSGWPPTYDLPAPVSQALELEMCATIPGACTCSKAYLQFFWIYIYIGLELLSHTVSPCLTFWGTFRRYSQQLNIL
jgi:hypothetical protein